MSRIHEALKKAASERTSQVGNATSSDVVELAGGSLVENLVAGDSRETLKREISSGELAAPGFDQILKKCHKAEWKIDARYSVFANETLYPNGAERFRTLRSRLYQVAATRPLKRLLITSSVPQEGKTFITSNLAQSFMRQENRKVLLIDGDLRASRLHLTLGAEPGPGLSEYLRGDADEFQVMQMGKEANLCLIPGGGDVPNPSELLHSKRMKSLLDRMSSVFDWIIVDSPPAIAVHDASILADMCDGVLFVVRAGKTDFELAQKAAQEFSEGNLLGVVLNRVEKNTGYPDYYYGYGKDRSIDKENNGGN